MKYVFTVQTSDDGLMNCAFTNIKALYNFIDEMDLTPETIFDKKEYNYTYSNLVKVIKANQALNRFVVATIYCKRSTTIDISDILVRSK